MNRGTVLSVCWKGFAFLLWQDLWAQSQPGAREAAGAAQRAVQWKMWARSHPSDTCEVLGEAEAAAAVPCEQLCHSAPVWRHQNTFADRLPMDTAVSSPSRVWRAAGRCPRPWHTSLGQGCRARGADSVPGVMEREDPAPELFCSSKPWMKL